MRKKIYVTEIDNVAKVLCSERWQQSDLPNISGYRDCILHNAPEFEQVCVVCENIRGTPWLNWSQKSPEWWIAYNKVKHERFKRGPIGNITQEYYKFANQGNVLKALMGLYQMEIYVLNFLTKRENKIEGFSYLQTALFSLDGGGWVSSNFHKEGEPFFWGHGMYW